MAINKVVYGQNTLIDLTGDTVSGNKMLSGTTAHDKSGSAITGSIASKSAATITPTTSDQTIAANQYLIGAQTILGDANLIAANIKKDVSIFGVTGTHEGGTTVQTYTGTFTADSSGIATLNCGFRPDVVFIDLGTYISSGYTLHAAICLPLFADRTNTVESIAWGSPIGVNVQVYVSAYYQTSTGCTIRMYQVTGSWGLNAYRGSPNTPFTAYKFL